MQTTAYKHQYSQNLYEQSNVNDRDPERKRIYSLRQILSYYESTHTQIHQHRKMHIEKINFIYNTKEEGKKKFSNSLLFTILIFRSCIDEIEIDRANRKVFRALTFTMGEWKNGSHTVKYMCCCCCCWEMKKKKRYQSCFLFYFAFLF